MKCPPDSNVRRDGTDENNPEYDEYENVFSRRMISSACSWRIELIPLYNMRARMRNREWNIVD